MTIAMRPSRHTYRAYPLDAAMSWFDPSTGTHVRWEGPETRSLRRVAPRVVMFALSHACNLACSFCSRDLGAKSAWTVASAAEMLAGLSSRRVLEVSFGGGEPFAFRGFDELLVRLHDETELAVHVTTNGVLLDDARIAHLRGRVGELRVSVYDDTPWEDRIARLADAGVRVGANVLATPARLDALPSLLERLRDLGAKDVAILSYVGADAALHLRPSDDARLARIVATSALRARVSVCLGDRLDPLPLAARPGCQAGLDFVTIGPDKRVKACSFAEDGFVAETPEDVLAIWRRERDALSAPSPRPGCARAQTKDAPSAAPSNEIRVYRAFSGNNSGECVLVGRFDQVEDARRYIDDLLPGFRAGERYSPEWEDLLRAEAIAPGAGEYSPDAMLAIGRSVMLHTDSAIADDFPSLRELLWRRGGRAVYNGIHEHGSPHLVAGLRGDDPARIAEVATARFEERFVRHGADVYGLVPLAGGLGNGIVAPGAKLEGLAKDLGAVIAAELVGGEHESSLDKALPSLARASEDDSAWLWARFFDEASTAKAAAAVSSDEGLVVSTRRSLLFRTARVRTRLAARLQQQGGTVTLVQGAQVRVSCTFSSDHRRKEPEPELERVRAALRSTLTAPFETSMHFRAVVVTATTDAPGPLVEAATRASTTLGYRVWLEVGPVEVTAAALRRIRSDLVQLTRRGPRTE